MLLKLRHDQIILLSPLCELSENVLQEFCKLAIEYLSTGSSRKEFGSAAIKLEVERQVVQDSVEGIAYLLIESAKFKLNELDFRDSMLTIGFSEEQEKVLSSVYASKLKELSDTIISHTFNIPHFMDLQWRFEAQVSSRSLLSQTLPQMTMKLTLDDNKSKDHILLQTDPKTLQHMTEVLEKALHEATSHNSRKIQRTLKIK